MPTTKPTFSIAVLCRGGDTRKWIQDFTAFVNAEVPPGPARVDNIEMRMESLACDFAMKHEGQADFKTSNDGTVVICFNFTGNRLADGWHLKLR